MRHKGNHVVIDLPSQAPPQASPGSRCDWQALGADQAAMARTTPSLPRAYDVINPGGGAMPLPHTNISAVNPGGGATPLPHKNIRKNPNKKTWRTVPSSPYGAQGRSGIILMRSSHLGPSRRRLMGLRAGPVCIFMRSEVGGGGRRWRSALEVGGGGRRWRSALEVGGGGRRWRSAVDFTFIIFMRSSSFSTLQLALAFAPSDATLS